MSNLCLDFKTFCEQARNAPLYYVRRYGIYHKGEVYWDEKLPKKPGSVVRFFEDTCAPCLSLVVFDLDGNFLCSAWPVSWIEDDHPSQHELREWWEALSQDERDKILRDAE